MFFQMIKEVIAGLFCKLSNHHVCVHLFRNDLHNIINMLGLIVWTVVDGSTNHITQLMVHLVIPEIQWLILELICIDDVVKNLIVAATLDVTFLVRSFCSKNLKVFISQSFNLKLFSLVDFSSVPKLLIVSWKVRPKVSKFLVKCKFWEWLKVKPLF
jgi:hypothetical protein